MIEIEDSVLIDRPPGEVFPLAADPRNMPLWNPAVRASEVHGPLRRGTTVIQDIDLVGRRFETVFELRRYEPARRVTYTSTAGPVRVEGTMHFRAEAGGTRVRWTVRGDCRGFLRIAERALVLAGKRELRSCLDRLKSLLEEGPVPESIAG